MFEEDKNIMGEAMNQQGETSGSEYSENTGAEAAGRSTSEPEYTYSQPETTAQEAPYRESGQNSEAHSEQRINMSHIPEEPVRRSRKGKNSMAKKVAGITAAAVLFGTVAGGTMFGVNTVAENMKKKYAPIEQTEVTLSKAEKQEESKTTTASAPASSAIMMDVSDIVEAAMPSVVAINNTMVLQQQTWFGFSQEYEAKSSGSGIIIGQNDDELLIVTNNHVVEDSKDITVTFIDESQATAAIKGTDSDSDLAVIAVQLSDIPEDTRNQIKIATIGDSDALKVGQGVIAIGNALGYGQSVTVGYVSALDREVKTDQTTTRNLLQTDAAINPGNSGGALLNMYGEVIGINSAKYSSTSVEGMGYAIPISKAQDIINDLMNKHTRVAVDADEQGYLGIQGQNIDDAAAKMYGMPKGIYVFKIMDNTAAAASDLHEKDIITKFDGQTVNTLAELKEMLTYYKEGTTVDLTVQSLDGGEYKERTVSVTLGKREAAETN
jgi:serine protease Do